MGDLYSEVLVKKRATVMDRLKKGGLILLMVAAAFVALFINVWFILMVIALGVASFFLMPMFDVEFEYLLVNRELDIDKIYAKSRRKKAEQFHLEEMEIFALEDSPRMDSYRNNVNLKTKDYSSRNGKEGVYAMIIRDDRGIYKVLLEPDDAMLDAMRKTFPNKVFVD
ncbi:MAG: hypothetical protein HFH60_10965 [Lachnospiraceae bacterium]|nr:hypothetical protein [Lachnospiraceae bacterium]